MLKKRCQMRRLCITLAFCEVEAHSQFNMLASLDQNNRDPDVEQALRYLNTVVKQ